MLLLTVGFFLPSLSSTIHLKLRPHPQWPPWLFHHRSSHIWVVWPLSPPSHWAHFLPFLFCQSRHYSHSSSQASQLILCCGFLLLVVPASNIKNHCQVIPSPSPNFSLCLIYLKWWGERKERGKERNVGGKNERGWWGEGGEERKGNKLSHNLTFLFKYHPHAFQMPIWETFIPQVMLDSPLPLHFFFWCMCYG